MTANEGVDGKANYVAECFIPGLTEAAIAHLSESVTRSTEDFAADGELVRYLGSTLFPTDEVVFFEFEGTSEEAVRRASMRAEIPFERIVESVHVKPTHGEGGTQ